MTATAEGLYIRHPQELFIPRMTVERLKPLMRAFGIPTRVANGAIPGSAHRIGIPYR